MLITDLNLLNCLQIIVSAFVSSCDELVSTRDEGSAVPLFLFSTLFMARVNRHPQFTLSGASHFPYRRRDLDLPRKESARFVSHTKVFFSSVFSLFSSTPSLERISFISFPFAATSSTTYTSGHQYLSMHHTSLKCINFIEIGILTVCKDKHLCSPVLLSQRAIPLHRLFPRFVTFCMSNSAQNLHLAATVLRNPRD